MEYKHEIRLNNNISEVNRAVEQVEAFGEERGLSLKIINTVNLALDELVTNIVSYGYDDEARHEIVIELLLDDEKLTVNVIDDAKAFNPLDQPEPDIDLPLEEKKIGGLGIHLIRNLLDELEYNRVGNKNVFTMKKKI